MGTGRDAHRYGWSRPCPSCSSLAFPRLRAYPIGAPFLAGPTVILILSPGFNSSRIHPYHPSIHGPDRRHRLQNVPGTWVTHFDCYSVRSDCAQESKSAGRRSACASLRISACTIAPVLALLGRELLLSLVFQIARIFPALGGHGASKKSLYELRIAKFFG
jgi:hypothetical protein